jgi:release factor glutamine methyltransferase
MDKESPVVHDALKIIRDGLSPNYPPGEIQGITYLIFENLLNYSKTDILLNRNTKLSDSAFLKIKEIIGQLKKNKPIQYILGEAWFYDLKLEVTPDTLIPRQETEELVRWVIDDTGSKTQSLLDIGTGCGCIAIALALNLPYTKVQAIDISEKAIQLARKNAQRTGADVEFIVDDIFSPLFVKSEKYDILVSNPPYVTETEKLLINKNVLHFEPMAALFVPDNQALIFYEAITALAREVLNPGGRLFLEINENKADEIEQLLVRSMFSGIEIRKDINGKFRMAKAVLQAAIII